MCRLTRGLLLAALAATTTLVTLPGALPAQGDPVQEFERYYKRQEDPASRVEAVLILLGYESPRVVDALLKTLDDTEPDVVRAAERVLGGFQTRAPVERMLEVLNKPSVRGRVAILNALAAGGYAAVAPALKNALGHKRWEVRFAAVRALAAAREPAVVEQLLAASRDSEPAVRCAAFEGLAPIDVERILAEAPRLLQDPSWQVRACAIGVLGGVRDRRSVGLLIPRMSEEEGRLVQDLARALSAVTGRNLGLSPEAWERFWASVGDDYLPPTEAELRRLAARRKKTAERYAGEVVRYHGVETPSRSILFVIDISASMEQLVVGQGEEETEEGKGLRRIDLVKRELSKTLDSLQSYVEFNILAFSTEVGQWKRSSVAASKSNKRAAKRWVEKLDVDSGASKAQTFYVPENITPAVASSFLDMESGRTNTYGALTKAMNIAGRGAFDRHYELSVDTILFLSDGMPSHGEIVAPDDIQREIRRANKLRRVVIHTIAIGEFNKDFMQELAEENGGTFIDLGH